MFNAFRRIGKRCVSFAEKQGFPVIVTICVAIITVCALWSGPRTEAYVSPTPPVNHDVSAAQLLQQTLREAATATPAPTQVPRQWMAPLDDISILRGYDDQRMVQSGASGLWSLHAAVDLAAARVTPVHAISDGTVLAHGEDALLGVWLRVQHGDVQALYAGMAMAGAYITGDAVDIGDTLGFVGAGPLEEQDLSPHLHLELTQDGTPINPDFLWATSP